MTDHPQRPPRADEVEITPNVHERPSVEHADYAALDAYATELEAERDRLRQFGACLQAVLAPLQNAARDVFPECVNSLALLVYSEHPRGAYVESRIVTSMLAHCADNGGDAAGFLRENLLAFRESLDRTLEEGPAS